MPRIARAVASGFPHHVVQRGNYREKIFLNDEDKEKYLSLLRKYSDKWDTPILAYCLMSNHVHLLTKPTKNESLYKMMQGMTLCYTQYINIRNHTRSGRPIGSESFIKKMERKLDRIFKLRSRGRPKKGER